MIQFRLPSDQAEAVMQLAERYQVTQATIVRWAIDALLRYAEAHGNRLILPVDFSQHWAEIVKEESQDSERKNGPRILVGYSTLKNPRVAEEPDEPYQRH